MRQYLGPGLVAVITIAGIAVSPYVQPSWIYALIAVLFGILLSLIRKTRYAAFGLIILAVLYGADILSLLVFTGTLAIVALGNVAFISHTKGLPAYLSYLVVGTLGSFAVSIYLGHPAPLIVVLGVFVGLLLRSVLIDRADSLMVELLGVAMTMFLFDELNYQVDLMFLLAAVITAFTLGYFSYRLKAADLSGLFSAALMGIILIVFADVRWFFVMLTFFILGSAATRFRFALKQEMGVSESHGGVRGYSNVFANGLVALSAAIMYGVSMLTGIADPVLFVALFLGSVASASADTIASEIGVVGGTPYLITSFERVAAGTNGGVTLLGEGASLIASLLIAITAFLFGIADPVMVLIVTMAGFVGTNVDSLVGATLENEGKIGNSGTNLVATLCGGVCAMLFYL